MDIEQLSCLSLPDGFGIEVDLYSGEVRKQIGPQQYEIDQFEAVATSYMLRSAARRLLKKFRQVGEEQHPAYRVVRCGHSVLSKQNGVQVFRAVQATRAHFAGVVQCGSVWHCAVCAKKIAVRRRAELVIATNKINEQGGACGLLTCTIPHAANECCSLVLERLQKLFDRLNAGRSALNFREHFDVIGQIKALEFTKGIHGWHPHVHSLIFTEKTPSWIEVADSLWSRWETAARKEFGWNLPRISIDLRSGNAAGDYVGKWGIEYEVAGGSLKTGRGESQTPFGLLSKFADGDKKSGEDWVEFATTVSRQGETRIQSTRQLVWSRGLKKRFGINDLTDEQIALQHEEPAVLLGTLNFEQWLKVLGQPYDARVVLLQIASVGNFQDVISYVENLPPVSGKKSFNF